MDGEKITGGPRFRLEGGVTVHASTGTAALDKEEETEAEVDEEEEEEDEEEDDVAITSRALVSSAEIQLDAEEGPPAGGRAW